IRTPMNGIIGLTQLLLDSNLSGEQKEFMRMIERSSFALLGLLNNLLDFSKIDSGESCLAERQFSFPGFIGEIVQAYSEKASSAGLYFRYNSGAGLPENLTGDDIKLRQVLANLLNNALKFTKTGGISFDSEMLPMESDNRLFLKFTVTDTGIGIAGEKQKIIFDSFTQADSSATKKFSGTGLGLTISKNIIEMMNGNIEVKSQLGKGSTFSFVVELKK
ncbi:MAG: sensor histidine kinase, partial [Methanococcaceae archaeon]